jgi:hypothetical protein
MGRKTNSSTGYLPDTLVGDASTGCDAGASVGLMMLGLLMKVKFEEPLVCWRSKYTRILT